MNNTFCGKDKFSTPTYDSTPKAFWLLCDFSSGVSKSPTARHCTGDGDEQPRT
jgi:hypothetical protein